MSGRLPWSRGRWGRVVLLAVWLLGNGVSVEACPACREALSKSEGEPGQAPPQDLAGSFNFSIVLMAAMPFVLLGSVVWTVARDQARGAQGEQDGSAARAEA